MKKLLSKDLFHAKMHLCTPCGAQSIYSDIAISVAKNNLLMLFGFEMEMGNLCDPGVAKQKLYFGEQ